MIVIPLDSFQFLSRGPGGEDNEDQGGQRAGARAGASGGNTPADFDDGEVEDIPFVYRDYRRSIVADIL